MIGLYSIEEYQMPLSDIAHLLAKRKCKIGTAFYRMKFEPAHGFGVTLTTLIMADEAEITLVVPQRIREIDYRIAQFTGKPIADYPTNRLDKRAAYFESASPATGWLPYFLRQIKELHPNDWVGNSECICNDGTTVYGDVLVFNQFMHSFSAYCASRPYSDFAWQFLHLGLLSFQEIRSLKTLAIMLGSL